MESILILAVLVVWAVWCTNYVRNYVVRRQAQAARSALIRQKFHLAEMSRAARDHQNYLAMSASEAAKQPRRPNSSNTRFYR